MISLKLGEETHYLPFISARALRTIGPMDAIYERASDNEDLGSDDMDAAIDWLCTLFNHQFTPDMVLDHYPMASFWVDVFTLYLSVRQQVEIELAAFPTPPEAMGMQRTPETAT